MTDGKTHLSIVICGHVDSGKSTTTGHLIFELGGIEKREMDKLKQEADQLGKGSFAFAFYMDRQKEERDRGVTISCTTKQFFTERYHYTIIDAPGHRDFIKNMISGAAQADCAVLMVPADGNFTTAIQKGNHKAGEVQGQTRQHARLINLLGVKQIIVGINKMDCDVAGYKEERYVEIRDEMKNMLGKIGYKKDFINNCIPYLPFSGWQGDNLKDKSTNMAWWNGQKVKDVEGNVVECVTLAQTLNDFVHAPARETDKALRVPISGVYKIKGVGDVLTGRVEQGIVETKKDVLFIPTHTQTLTCEGKVFTIEMHHTNVDAANPGDNVGMNIKGINKDNPPHNGDVMIYKGDESLKGCQNFTAQIQTLDVPGELKKGYSPIGFVRCGRSACKMTAIDFKKGKETGGQKVENPNSLKANEMAQAVFEPIQPFAVESFKTCEGLSRIAFLDGNTAIMLGKVVKVTFKA